MNIKTITREYVTREYDKEGNLIYTINDKGGQE